MSNRAAFILGVYLAVVSVLLAGFAFPLNLLVTIPASFMVGWFGAGLLLDRHEW